MNVLQARVVFRDRPLADVLDLALRFCAVQGLRYAKVALATTVPLFGITLAVAYAGGPVWGWLTAIPLAIAAQLPFTVLASRLVFQDDVTVKNVLAIALKEAPRVIFVRTITLALVVASSIFVIVPFVLAAIFLFLGEVMLLERAPLAAAMTRARRVSVSSVGDALLAIFALALIPAAAILLAEVGGRGVMSGLLQLRPPAALWDEGWSVLAFAGLFAIAPYAATARFFVYLNIRTRTEGWDIQTRFAAIAARASREERAEAA